MDEPSTAPPAGRRGDLVGHGRLAGDADVRILTKTNRGIRGVCTYSTLYVQERFGEREGART